MFSINTGQFLHFPAFLHFDGPVINSFGTRALPVSLVKEFQQLWHIIMEADISPQLVLEGAYPAIIPEPNPRG